MVGPTRRKKLDLPGGAAEIGDRAEYFPEFGLVSAAAKARLAGKTCLPRLRGWGQRAPAPGSAYRKSSRCFM